MRLVAIEGRDWLSYPSIDLDLRGIPQVAVVGRNGAGKSALLEAVLWCLYGQGRGSTDEMIREGRTDTWVTTTWQRKDEEVVITRSRSKLSQESSLRLTVGGEDRTATRIPDTQARIERLLGMRYRAMTAGPVMVQGESGSLLQAKPAEATDLLVELFGLERWAAYHEEAKTKRDNAFRRSKEADEKHAELQSILEGSDILGWQREIHDDRDRLREQEAELDAEQTRLTQLHVDAAVLQERANRAATLRSTIERLEASASETRDQHSRLKGRVDESQVVATRKPPPRPVEPDPFHVESTRDAVNESMARLNVLSAARNLVPDLERRLADAQRRALADSPCGDDIPQCQFTIAAAQARDEAVGIETSIHRAVEDSKGLEQEQANAARLSAELEQAKRELEEARRKYVTAKPVWDAFTATKEAARLFLADAIPMLDDIDRQMLNLGNEVADRRRELLVLDQDEFKMRMLAGQINASSERIGQTRTIIEALSRGIDTTQRLIDGILETQRQDAEVMQRAEVARSEHELYVTLAKAFHRSGIPTMVLEQAIPEIETRANEILRRLPDDYSIRIDTKVATKAQTFKDELRVLVLRAGRERPYHMLSGGQRFRVEFAVRIALAAVIAARVDATVDTLWLDEPLGPLDREGQEAVSDTLDAVRSDFGLIAVVSHVPDFNDRFDTRISVTMDDDESEASVA